MSLLWNRSFKNLQILHAFAHQYSSTKNNFSKHFPKFSSYKMTVYMYNNNRARTEMGKQNSRTFPGLFQDFFHFTRTQFIPNFV